MCGIWGFMSTFSSILGNEAKFCEDAMITGAIRGENGTGIIMATSHGKVSTYKKKHNPYWLKFDKDFQQAFKLHTSQLIIGHNRHATVGEVTDENTHPFKKDHIIMVHNGTIRSGLDIPAGITDSEVLAQKLAEEGTTIFEHIFGAWTSVWVNSKENSLNFVCNGDRPFSLVKVRPQFNYNMYQPSKESFDGWAFASEFGMLAWLLGRNKLDIVEVVKIEVDKHYKIYLNNAKDLIEVKTLKKPVWRETEKYVTVSEPPTNNSLLGKLRKLSKKNDDSSIIYRILGKEGPSPETQLFKYTGISNKKEGVFFYSGTVIPDDQLTNNVWFMGTIHAKIIENGVPYYQVKHRKSETLSTLPLDEQEPKKQNTGIVTNISNMDDSVLIHTKLKGKILVGEAKDILMATHGSCMSCKSLVHLNELFQASVVTNQNDQAIGFLCPTCTTDIELGKKQ